MATWQWLARRSPPPGWIAADIDRSGNKARHCTLTETLSLVITSWGSHQPDHNSLRQVHSRHQVNERRRQKQQTRSSGLGQDPAQLKITPRSYSFAARGMLLSRYRQSDGPNPPMQGTRSDRRQAWLALPRKECRLAGPFLHSPAFCHLYPAAPGPPSARREASVPRKLRDARTS